MRLLTAVLDPLRLEHVHAALDALGVTGMTVTESSGYGRRKGHTEVYRGAEYDVDRLPVVRVEALVADDDVADVLEVLVKSAQAGPAGDVPGDHGHGLVWVTPVETLVRVSTGERGDQAL